MASTYYDAQEQLTILMYVDALTLGDIIERYGVLEGVLKKWIARVANTPFWILYAKHYQALLK